MQYFDKRGKPQSFLRRLLLHPSRIAAFVCLLFIIAFVRYQKPSFEDPRSAAHRQLFESSSPEKKDGGRIAIVTFTTDQKSYTHLSLKNHVRKSRPSPSRELVKRKQRLIGSQTMQRNMATTSLSTSSRMLQKVQCGISLR